MESLHHSALTQPRVALTLWIRHHHGVCENKQDRNKQDLKENAVPRPSLSTGNNTATAAAAPAPQPLRRCRLPYLGCTWGFLALHSVHAVTSAVCYLHAQHQEYTEAALLLFPVLIHVLDVMIKLSDKRRPVDSHKATPDFYMDY